MSFEAGDACAAAARARRLQRETIAAIGTVPPRYQEELQGAVNDLADRAQTECDAARAAAATTTVAEPPPPPPVEEPGEKRGKAKGHDKGKSRGKEKGHDKGSGDEDGEEDED